MRENIEIIQSFCIWTDLLGFGNAFIEGGWSLGSESSQKNIERLKRLETSLHRSNDPSKEVAFVLNDGLARVCDLPNQNEDVMQFLWWLHTALSNHWLLNASDMQYNSLGVRTVMSFGDRVKAWRGHTTYGDHFLGNTKHKEIANKRICIYSPDEFQLNLAFSKAYIIESSGSKGGLSGPNLFIDELALNVIESFLSATKFEHLMPDGQEDHGSYGILKIRKTTASYEISKYYDQGIFAFEIARIVDGKRFDVMSMHFEAIPVRFSGRGIETNVLKLLKYFPLDEAKPFCFDFQDYRWKS